MDLVYSWIDHSMNSASSVMERLKVHVHIVFASAQAGHVIDAAQALVVHKAGQRPADQNSPIH